MNKYVIPMALMAVLLVGGIATVEATNNMNNKEAFESKMVRVEEKLEMSEEEITSLMESIPAYEEAKRMVGEAAEDTTVSKTLWGEEEAVPIVRRFILWTHDGVHVMWGTLGNGYFIGEDNEDVEVWGIYHGGTFAGFYGDEFFHGAYRGNKWVALNLFGENLSYGKFELFPKPHITATQPRPVIHKLKAGRYGTPALPEGYETLAEEALAAVE